MPECIKYPPLLKQVLCDHHPKNQIVNIHKIQQNFQIAVIDVILVFNLDRHSSTVYFQNNAHLVLVTYLS